MAISLLRYDDSTANQIDVYCDGYVVRIHTDGSDEYIGEILDPDNLATAWARFGSKVVVSSTTYALSEDTGISVVTKENTPAFVQFEITGDFETSAQASLTNEAGSKMILTIYPDQMTMGMTFEATGSITLDDDADNGICFMEFVAANVASEDAAYEASGSETTASSDGEQNSADYIALISTEINIIGVNFAQSLGGGTASFGQYIDDPADGALRFRWNDGTVTAASTMSCVWVFDSADRSGGKKYTTGASRVEIGNDKKDAILDQTVTDGDDVTDMVILEPIFNSEFSELNSQADTETVGNGSLNQWVATQFSYTGTTGAEITKIDLYLHKNNSPTMGLRVALYTNNATPDPDDPNAIVGEWSPHYDSSGFPTSEGKVSFRGEFGSLTNGTLYWIVLNTDATDGTNYILWNRTSAGATENVARSSDGSSWLTSTTFRSGRFEIFSSGTLHLDGSHIYTAENSADGVTDIDIDIDRHSPILRVIEHPWHTGTLASPTDAKIEEFKFDDNAASTTVTAAVGNNATWEDSAGTGRNTNNDDISTDIDRGTGLDTKDTYHVDCSTTVYDNAYFKQGTYHLSFTPQFGYDDAADQTLWHLYVDADDYLQLVYDVGNDRYEFRASWGGTLTTINGSAYTENNSLQQLTDIFVGWDSDEDFLYLAVNGQVVDNGTNTGTPSASGAAYVHIGANSDGDGTTSLNADIYLAHAKVMDGCWLPYGGFHIGNGQGLLADIDNPHDALTWYFDGQAAEAKGGTDLGDDDNPTNSGGSFVTTSPIIGSNHWDSNGASNVLSVADTAEDICDYSKGFIAGWFNVQSASGGEYLIDVSDADDSDRISAVLDASNNIDVTYRSGSTDETITGDIAVTDGDWFYLKITWDDSDQVHSYINGIENGTPQDIANSWGGGTGLTWYFTEDHNGSNGVDAFIGMITMGNDPNTPEIWTKFGEPRHTLKVDKK